MLSSRMRWRRGGLTASLLLVVSGCGAEPTGLEIELEAFDAIPILPRIDGDAVRTPRSYDYWELRRSFTGPGHEVVLSSGSKDGLDPEIAERLDAVEVDHGFDVECLPGLCYKYVVSVRGSTIESWATVDSLRLFLGTIDTREDAMLLAAAEGFDWSGEVETGAIRPVEGGYEMVALRLVETCDPIRTDRFLLAVQAGGAIEELGSEVWEEEPGVCI